MTPRTIDDDFDDDDLGDPIGPPDPPRRRRRAAVALAALVGAGAIAAIAIAIGTSVPAERTAQPGDDAAAAEPSATPLALPTPTPAPLGDEASSEQAAVASVEALVTATNEVLQRADGGTEGLDAVAVGFVKGEVEALALERSKMGYTQVGQARITSTTVDSIDLAAAPPTAQLSVCIDTSDIDVLDANGDSVADQLYRPGHPVLNRYGLVYTDGLWRVSTHDIPDGATCA